MLIGAHRGAHKDNPRLDENSIPAFERAIEWGCDYVEFDVHKTKDNQFIVYHNNYIQLNAKKVKIYDLNFAELENFCLPITEESIPKLDQVIKLCKGKIIANVEVKDPGIGYETCKFINSINHNSEDFFISSFHFSVLKEISEAFPSIKLAYLFFKLPLLTKPIKIATSVKAKAINPYYRILTSRLLREAKNCALDINIWTVPRKKFSRFLIDDRISSIITDDVKNGLEIREKVSHL